MTYNRDQLLGDIFRDELYKGNSIPEIERNIATRISKQEDFKSDFLMGALANQMLIASNLRVISNSFHEIANLIAQGSYEIICKNFPDVKFVISGRRKSFLSEIHKRYNKVLEYDQPNIKDILAIRIVLLDYTNAATLRNCYRIFQEIVSSFTKIDNTYLKGIFLEISEPDRLVTSSEFSSDNYPSIVLPDESIINEFDNLHRISKDYIRFPKKNGYQSIHGTFEVPVTSKSLAGLNLELQIRTLAQHEWSEYHPDANHSKFKEDRTATMDKIFYFDPEKVHIPGYVPGKFDIPGLVESVPLVRRQKTF